MDANEKTVTSTQLRTPATPSVATPPDFSGTTFGAYQLVRKIAEGGMGVVYEAVQTKLDRRVALKILNDQLASRPEFLQRFQREAKAAAALNHPNIVQVYDFVEVEGRHCLIMEFIEGEDLSMFVDREGKFTVAEALEIIDHAAQALKFACGKSIIHRDIKPSNLMLTSEGRVKVADLGLAKILTEDSDITMTNMTLGSPHFIAPEQAQDARRVDHRVDIYALGITLLYLATGKRPYDGGTPFSVVLAHVNKPLPSGAELGTTLPESVEALIRRMAAKNPDERYPDYDSLLADVQLVKAGFAPVAEVGPSRSSKKLIVAGAVAAVVIIAVLASLLLFSPKKSRDDKSKQSAAVTTNSPIAPVAERPSEPPPSVTADSAQRNLPPSENSRRPESGGPPPEMEPGGVRLPMGPPPRRNFYTIPDGPVSTMLAKADEYAAQHKENYGEIIDVYEQVMRKAPGAERPAVDRKLSDAIQSQEKVVAEVMRQYESKMQEQLRAGKPDAAYNVWKDFPSNLRSREVDDQIRKIFKQSLPPDFSPGRPGR